MVDAAFCLPHAASDHEALFFSGTKCAQVSYKVGEIDQLKIGPKNIQTLIKTDGTHKFGRVDAIVRVPGFNADFYVFCGARYLQLTFDTALKGTSPTPIQDKWKTLAKHGFDRVDAAMVVPGSTKNIYFFRGKEWIDVSLDDKLISYGTIEESWPSFVEAGFDTVDAILSNNDDTYYVFSRARYACIRMEKDKDVLVGPVHHISKWASLKNWV